MECTGLGLVSTKQDLQREVLELPTYSLKVINFPHVGCLMISHVRNPGWGSLLIWKIKGKALPINAHYIPLMTSFSITDNISPSKIIPLLHWLLQTDYLGFTSDIKNRVGGAVNKILCDGRYIIKLMQSKDREFGEPNLDIRQHVDWMKSYS